jgi:MYXO-CTERM domain-containing protein
MEIPTSYRSLSSMHRLIRTGSTLAAHEIEQIRIRALHTTGTGSTWIDDVHVELVAAPEPGTVTLAGLGLLGLAGFGRRRRR